MTDEFDQAIDEICNRFKAAWDAFLTKGDAKRPEIEQYLQQVTDDPEKLLDRLLHLEIARRQVQGEQPLAEEYEQRFAEHTDLVKQVFHLLEGSDSDSTLVGSSGSLEPPHQIGPYHILKTIGEGGMGSVYLAEQTKPVCRRVALKVIKAGMDTKQVVARFEAERQVLAMMDHQNIAKVLDAGITVDEKPYFAMELVNGIPITKYCDQHKLKLNDRLVLLIQVCRAIHHAHRKGVIHRDLKPSNVLVALHDGVPVAKVIDFGLAKALQPQLTLTDKTLVTYFGQIIGTLEYMSPEQALLNELEVDTRTDVYSLGVILYELLAGSTPLGRERIRNKAYHQVLELMRDEEPPRPSTRLSEAGKSITGISQQRQIEPRRLSLILKGELDWIAIKALEKDRTRRYDGAGSLADDLQRYLNKEVILARPPSVGYRLNKTIRKHKAAFASGTTILALLFAGLIVIWTMWMRAMNAELQARKASVAALSKAEWAIAAEIRAENNFDTANKNLQAANDAVDDFFTTVSEADLLNQPRMEPLRKLLLEKALNYYLEVVETQSTNPKLMAKLANAHGRLGAIHLQLGDHEDAVAEYQKMRDIFKSLGDQFQEHPDFINGLARSYHNLSLTFDRLGKLKEATAASFQAMVIYEGLAEGHSYVPGHAEGLGTVYNNYGSLLQRANRQLEAAEKYRMAIELCQRLVEEHPEVSEHANNLAMSYNNFANLLKNMGKLDEAVIEFGKAIEMRALLSKKYPDVLAKEHPRVPVHAGNLIISYENLGRLEQGRHRYSEAITHFQRSLKLLQSLKREGRVASGLDDIAQQVEQQIAFCKSAQSAIEKLSFAIAQPPDQASELLLVRGTVLAKRGDHLAAAESGEKLATLVPHTESSDNLYNAACLLSLASASANMDEQLTQLDRSKAAQEYAVRAMEFLHQAKTVGCFKDIEHVTNLKNNSDFEPLRERTDFLKFIEGLSP